MIDFSLVVPAYNEEDHLPGLLESVDTARHRYHQGADRIEVIVAENGSTDATGQLARSLHCRVVEVEGRTIAGARNAGAHQASGQVLAFVDADSRIHPETFNAIHHALTDRVVVGATGVRMDRTSPGIAITMLVAKTILLIGGWDSGVVFCRRADWAAVDGYNEKMRFGEDVQFLRDLKRLGRPRRQRFVRARGATTITSARKFDRHGDWHFFALLPKGIFWLLFNRAAMDRFAQSYWYRRQ